MAQRAAPTLAQRFTAPSGAHGFDAANVTRQIEQNSTLPMETVDTATGEVILETAPHSSTVEPAAHNSSGTGSNPVAGTNTAESAAPADSGASRTEGDASLPPLAREVFEQFSGALLRVNKSENLTKAKEEFFRGKGMKINETDLALFQRIYAQHEDRIARSLDRAKFAVDVAKMIAHEVPEERL